MAEMISFAPPRIDQKIIDAVTDALKSGWITTGPRTKQFEKNIAEYCSAGSVICINSATAGLELMLRWYGVGAGDEVIVPAYTYAATANVVVHCGAKPVMVDVGTDFNIDIKKISPAINENTKVIIPVDFGGWPCNYEEINSLVNEKDIKSVFKAKTANQEKLGRILILSDAAHSIGAQLNGKRTGSLTDATVFSFHAVKNLTTAEGGAICLNFSDSFDNSEIYNELCIKSLHGQNKDALAKMQNGNWRYDVIEAGYKFNMTDILASMGIVEIERYDSETLPKRKELFSGYINAFKEFVWAELPFIYDKNKKSSFHLFPLRIKGISEATRDNIIKDIFEQNVSVNVHFIPLPMLSFYKNKDYNIEDYPVAYDNYSREISLPLYYDLNLSEQQRIIDAVITSVDKHL
jgi:dTDP-4-amino-4,6-dideoxygalactose transaminase